MRIGITLLAIVLGLLVAVGAFMNAASKKERSANAPIAASAPARSETSPQAGEDASPQAAAAQQTPVAEPAEPPAPLAGLHLQPARNATTVVIGSEDPSEGFRMKVELTSWGAGIRRITLADYDQRVQHAGAERIAHVMTEKVGEKPGAPQTGIPPYAAQWLRIEDQVVNLYNQAQWAVEEPQRTGDAHAITLRAPVLDETGRPVAEVVRTFVLTRGSYDLQIHQEVRNLLDRPLRLAFQQYIQGELPEDEARYIPDRLIATGYFPLSWDASRNTIRFDSGLFRLPDLLSRFAAPESERGSQQRSIWPNSDVKAPAELAWLASENRYFALVTHLPMPTGASTTREVPALDQRFPRLGTVVFPDKVDAPHLKAHERHLILTVGTEEMRLAPGAAADLSLAVYAGPRDREVLQGHPYDLMHLVDLIRYEITCTFCTFQWLAHLLLWFMGLIHAVTFDWGIAIIALVLVVRLLLHPITKRAQFNMMKLGKAMQSMQPELEKLKAKYKDDSAKLNAEMMKLYREKGVNPANALGCLPMFLQMPIWIALYAMLYFAIELRHQPAFYGIFQVISGGNWLFLADLSSPDNFIRFAAPGEKGYEFTWIPFITMHFAAINILPILMAVVFFFQQKLTMPPPANEQAAQQQRMMRIMVLIFPIFLYSAPSGLTLYILASTFAGIVDSWIVRRHMKRLEESGELFKPRVVRPGSLGERLQKFMAAKQEQLQQIQTAQQSGGRGAAGRPNFKSRKK